MSTVTTRSGCGCTCSGRTSRCPPGGLCSDSGSSAGAAKLTAVLVQPFEHLRQRQARSDGVPRRVDVSDDDDGFGATQHQQPACVHAGAHSGCIGSRFDRRHRCPRNLVLPRPPSLRPSEHRTGRRHTVDSAPSVGRRWCAAVALVAVPAIGMQTQRGDGDALHLGPAAIGLDPVGGAATAESALPGRYVGAAGQAVRRPAVPDERPQRVLGVPRRRDASCLFDSYYAVAAPGHLRHQPQLVCPDAGAGAALSAGESHCVRANCRG